MTANNFDSLLSCVVRTLCCGMVGFMRSAGKWVFKTNFYFNVCKIIFNCMRQGMLNLPSECVPHRCTGVRGCSCNFTVMQQGMLNLPSEYVRHRCTGVRGCSYNFTLSERVCMWFVRQTKHAVVKHRRNVCSSFFVIFILWKLFQDCLVWYRWRTSQPTDCQVHKCLSLVRPFVLAGEGVVIYF